jgi:hypothetical protein
MDGASCESNSKVIPTLRVLRGEGTLFSVKEDEMKILGTVAWLTLVIVANLTMNAFLQSEGYNPKDPAYLILIMLIGMTFGIPVGIRIAHGIFS